MPLVNAYDINTVRTMRNLLNETNLTPNCPYARMFLIAYSAFCQEAHFQLLSIVICYFIAEI
jgi:hypothetical protein